MHKIKNVAFVVPGALPFPPVKGGAVENLVESLRRCNEGSSNIQFTFFSVSDEAAQKVATDTKNSKYIYIKIPLIIKATDKFIYSIVKRFFKKKKITSYRYILQRSFYIYRVAQYLKKANYDRVILENHGTLLYCLKLFNNKKKYKGRYYYHIHNITPNFYGCEDILVDSAAIIGVSAYVLSTLPKNIQDKSNMVVLKNKVDEKRFNITLTDNQREKYRKKYKLGDKKIVLFSGRLYKDKGIKELLLAWKKINPKNAVLLIVGGAYYKSDIKSDFERELFDLVESLQNSVKFTGFIDYQEMPIVYALADLVVLPSTGPDAAPLTVIETITAERPLITSNSGGIPEYAKKENIVIDHKKRVVDNLVKYISGFLDGTYTIKRYKSGWNLNDFYNDFIEIIHLS